MAIELTMPALSPTMEKGTLAKWLVGEGDTVRPGDLIAEIETDKATMEYEAVDEGRIARLLIAEGTDDVAVGTVIALLAEGDEAVEPAREKEFVGEAVGMSAVAAAPSAPVEKVVAVPDAQEAAVTPLARRIAAMRHISLAGLKGSGARGRIVKADLGLPSPVAAAPIAAALPVETLAPPPAGVPVETVKLSSMRKTIARRLTQSKQSVPHFYLTARCRLDPLLRLREELNASLAPRGVKLSVNDLLLKALALALADVPDANVQFGGDVLHRFGRVDIAMAVAIEGGLVTPVLRDVGALSLSAIARESRALADKARDGRLVPEEYAGGTVSLSNLGMFGIDEMFPVINPPQALILGVGAGVEQPWKVEGALGFATIMAATASFDHRAIDGAVAARFMAALRERIEEPLSLCC